MREGRRQIGRHDAWDQECQPDEAEAVQDEQRPQRFGPLPEAEFRPDISSGDDPPRDEAECDAHEKPDICCGTMNVSFLNSSKQTTSSDMTVLSAGGGEGGDGGEGVGGEVRGLPAGTGG